MPVSISAQQADCRSLDGNQPSDHHIYEHRSDAHEHRRDHAPECLQLVNLACQESIGDLIFPAIGADRSEGKEALVDLRDDPGKAATCGNPKHSLIEGPLPAGNLGQGPLIHPDDTVPLFIGNQLTRRDGVNMLR